MSSLPGEELHFWGTRRDLCVPELTKPTHASGLICKQILHGLCQPGSRGLIFLGDRILMFLELES